MKTYAGIGTREKNPQIAMVMWQLALFLYSKGYGLNSGGAEFSDTIHEQAYIASGADKSKMNIYLPWSGFNGRSHDVRRGYYALEHYDKAYLEEAYKIAAASHPNWAACSRGAKALHTRNVLQVLGANLNSPVSFVVAYTANGLDSGGTAQACRIARAKNIPVKNIYHQSDVDWIYANA